jgi:hypothetical protein
MKYRSRKRYGHGGNIDDKKAMILSQIKEVHHHADELAEVVAKMDTVDAWVVGKMERATTDLSDITHYLDGTSEYMADGGMMAKGGRSLMSMANLVVKDELKNTKLKNWYTKKYPTDDLGEEISATATFKDLWDCLHNNGDVYKIIGVGDSVIRERLFDQISEMTGHSDDNYVTNLYYNYQNLPESEWSEYPKETMAVAEEYVNPKYIKTKKYADGGMMMARGGEVRYKLKGNNFADQIENGRKFKVLIEKVFNNQSGENRYPLNFISETAFIGKIVKRDGKNWLKDYSYNGTLSKYEFLDDKDFIEALKYVDRPAIRKFEDGGMADAPEIEILNNDGRLKVYYIKGNIGFDGTLKKYHSGRDFEYEFEPDNFDDEESEDFYYNDGDNVIENEILDYFYANFDKMEDGGTTIDDYDEYNMVVITKELEKDGGHYQKWDTIVSARNIDEAKKIATEKWKDELRLSDLRLVEVISKEQYRLNRDVYMQKYKLTMKRGGRTRGSYTYVPKEFIDTITTSNDVEFDNKDILDGTYIKGKNRKFALGGSTQKKKPRFRVNIFSKVFEDPNNEFYNKYDTKYEYFDDYKSANKLYNSCIGVSKVIQVNLDVLKTDEFGYDHYTNIKWHHYKKHKSA